MGLRPEKSDKETTSLGTSSLPTCGGSDNAAHSLGLSSKISHPVSLDRSVSAPASICSYKPSSREIVDLKADSPVTSDEKECPPFLDPPPQASSDCTMDDQPPGFPRSAPTLWNSSKETIMADDLKSPATESTCSIKGRPDTQQKEDLSALATRVPCTQTYLDKNDLCSPYQDPSQGTGPQHPPQPVGEQSEAKLQREPSSPQLPWSTGLGSELQPSLPPTQQRSGDSQTENRGAERAMLGHPQAEDSAPSSAPFGSSFTETIMEIDVAEQSMVAVHSLASGHSAGTEDAEGSDLNLWVEAEASKPNSSSVIVSTPVSASDLQPPESNVEMSETESQLSYLLRENCSSLSLSGDGLVSTDPAAPTEESALSVTAALKELHQLLVISCQESPGNLTSEEVIHPKQTAAEDRTESQEKSEQPPQSLHPPVVLQEPEPQDPSCQVRLGPEKAERLTQVSSCAGGQSGVGGNVDERVAAAPGDVQKSQESKRGSFSFTGMSVETVGQLNSVGTEISPRHLAGEERTIPETSQQTEALPSDFLPVLSQDPQNPLTGMPDTRESAVCPEATRPLHRLEQLVSSPASSPSPLLSHLFPTADVDRILQAGFSLREALGALQRVGGDVDLALLILLAKNIIVPT